MEFVQYVLNLVFVIPIILLLFFITVKLGKTSLAKIGAHNHVTVLEKVNLSKDSSVFVLKLGNEGCVGVLSSTGFEVVQKLNSEEIAEIEDKKKQILNQNSDSNKNKVPLNLKNGLKGLRK